MEDLKKKIQKKQKLEMMLTLVLFLLLLPFIVLRGLWALISSQTLFSKVEVIGYKNREFKIRSFAGPGRGKRLAEIFNILSGDMDLSGLPPVVKDSDKMPDDEYFNFRTGIYSLFKANEKIGKQQPDIVSVEREYIENWSMKQSFKLLAQATACGSIATPAFDFKYKLNFFGIQMFNGTMQSSLDWIFERIENKERTSIAFANADCLNQAFGNTEYYNDLQKFDEIYPDGIGIRIAAKMLSIPVKENINGTDMFPLLCERISKISGSIFLLGAREGVAKLVSENMKNTYPDLNVAGYQHGYFLEEEEASVIEAINSSGADILFVAFGAPLQEHWIIKNKELLKPTIRIGVGGCFDFYSNRIKRAPALMRKLGFEWLYRLIQEPERMWHRYIVGNPLFIFRIWKLGKHRLNASLVTQYETEKLMYHFSNLERGKWRNNCNFKFKKYSWIWIIFFAKFFKRLIDVFSSGLGLIVLSPVFITVIILIKLESKGGAFYHQTRIGRYGTSFKFWKFRSMRMDSDIQREQLVEDNNEMDGGVIFKMKNDPRITKIGKFIRKYSIDELPQLWNVLIGDMSLVGPRPAMPDEVEQYTAFERKRLAVTPGITGIWQVSGRSNIPFEEQVKLDELYIQSQSFWRDILILLKTIPAVIFGKGAY